VHDPVPTTPSSAEERNPNTPSFVKEGVGGG